MLAPHLNLVTIMWQLLYIEWDISPILFQIGRFSIRWYSVLFTIGLFPLGYLIMKSFFSVERKDVNLLDPLLSYIFLGTLIGARLGHCLFYSPEYYFANWRNLLEILCVWKGGLASHGGAIGVLIAIWLYNRRYGKLGGFDLLWLLDRICIPACFAGCLIRLGNLMNSEIYGSVTDLPWGFIFVRNGEIFPRHPTQLYESICYLGIGLILLIIYRRKNTILYKGGLFGVFLCLLFGVRFLIEFIKLPQVSFESNMYFNMGQCLSLPFICLGIILIYLSCKSKCPLRV